MVKYIAPNGASSGIRLSYVKSRKVLDISGWYDSCVGIEGAQLTLRELFTDLGVTLKDCQDAFKEVKLASPVES